MFEEALQIAVHRNKRQMRKGKIYPFECRVPKRDKERAARRDKKAFLRDQCKETEENNRVGMTRDLFKKIRDTKKLSWKDKDKTI